MNAHSVAGAEPAEAAGAIAHDFNNVLTVIAGNLALAERHAAGNPKLIKLLDNIRLAADRATDLTNRLMTLSAPEAGPSQPDLAGNRQAASTEPSRKILVVEDDADVAEVAAAVLENLGHHVAVCPDADTALAALGTTPDFDLVFSDIMMPGPMNGIDLAETIARQFPDMPVLLATGFSNAALAPRALRFPVLAKPYSVQDLSRRIGQLLRARH